MVADIATIISFVCLILMKFQCLYHLSLVAYLNHHIQILLFNKTIALKASFKYATQAILIYNKFLDLQTSFHPL